MTKWTYPGQSLSPRLIALVFLLGSLTAHAAVFFETTNTQWRLRKGQAEASVPITDWRQAGFDDVAWTQASSPFYYSSTATEPPFYNGGAFTGTLLGDMSGNYSCIFLRKSFVVNNPGAVNQLWLDAAGDDGFVAWINGVEVARTNLAAGAPTYQDTSLSAAVEPVPLTRFVLAIPGSFLVAGANVLAVQAFNSAIDSSDFGFMAALSSPPDVQAPVLLSAFPPGGVTLGDLTQLEVTFNEIVTNINAADLRVNGLPAVGMTPLGAGRYRFNFPQPAPGPVTVSWAGSQQIQDLAGNAFAGGSWTYLLDPNLPPAPIIREIMAANSDGLMDEDGDHPDWIELFNPQFVPLNLDGWFLTDDPDRLNRWQFPAVILPSGGYLLVYASGKDRRQANAPLHANFMLSAEGEFLALVSPNGTIVSAFSPAYPKQKLNVSYGLVGNTGTNGFLSSPTPGAANVADSMRFVADTKFSHDRGFYGTNFLLTLSCATPGATIYYTTNGTAPGVASGTPYPGPLLVSRTTTIRARAEQPGWRSSDVDTHTYLFLRDVRTQSLNGAAPPGWPSSWGNNSVDYGMDPDIVTRLPWSATISNDLRAIPTVSIVMRLADLFDADTGIYANAESEGIDWERPASVELIYPDGQKGFQLDAGLRIRGGFSRLPQNPKHSFRVICRDDYGQARLRYPLFGFSGAPDFDRFDLRTSQDNSYAFQGDPGATFLSDPFVRDTLLATGQPGERGDWYHLYLNGQYWGLYNTCERPEGNFAASYFGGAADDYDVLKPDPQAGYVLRVTQGDDAAWRRLWQAAVDGFGGNAAYFQVQGRNPDGSVNPAFENLLEVTNLVDYLLTIIYSGDFDGPIYGDLNNGFLNNFYAFRSRLNTGGFRFVTHDAELALQDLNENRAGTSTRGSPSRGDGPEECNPHYLATRLRANAEFKMLFADRVQKHFFDGGAMTPGAAQARYQRRTNELHQAITGESARWGDAQMPTDPITRNNWLDAVSDRLSNYFPYRSAIVLDQLRAEHLFPNVVAAQFSRPGGEVPFGSAVALTNSSSSGTIYYTLDGKDPRNIGGGLYAAAQSYTGPIIINASQTIRARVKSGSTWSPLVERTYYPAQDLRGIRITEIMYHPPAVGAIGGEEFEFLELKNAGTLPVDLGGAYFTGFSFVFSNGTVLAPGAFFVLARNAAQLTGYYPGLTVHGVFGGKLDNGGETISLHTAWGAEIDSVDYSDHAPWPVAADGWGFSIVPVSPSELAGGNYPAGWRASSAVGGSPGTDDPPPVIPPVRINEVLTHTDLPQLDSVELFNPTAAPVNLAGWYLTDDLAVPMKFRIPAGSIIAANGYLVFTEADFSAGGPAFALSSTGEDLYLLSGMAAVTNLTGYSHGLKFGASANGVSFGRFINSAGEEQFPAQKSLTLGTANSGPRVGPAVINEIQYHPLTGDPEYVEVLNISGAPLGLFDAANPDHAWRLNGLNFDFPPGVTLAANGLALVVGTDPASFRSRYGVPGSVPIFGPFSGILQDNGEQIELQRPDSPNTNGLIPYLTVDAVRYRDRWPWPIEAAGDGSALQRLSAAGYGNDPTNWFASGLTPGAANRPTLGPPLVEQPQSQTVSPGATVVFSVSALGNSLNYQWRFNGTNLLNETNQTLVLPGVTLSQAGGYRVTVTGATGSSTSQVAVLTVQCSYQLSAASSVFSAAGGDGSVIVLTLSGCSWEVADVPAWVTLTSSPNGTGSSPVSFTVAPYTGTHLRSATLNLAGRSYLIVQSPPDSSRPQVGFSMPAANARLTNSTALFAGTASDNVGLARVEYEADSGGFQLATGTTAWNVRLPLVAGTNTIRVRSIDWSGNVSVTNSRSIFRVVSSPLFLFTNGQGSVFGAARGELLEVGRTYSLKAVPAAGFVFSNWTGGASGSLPALTFLMRSNLTISANFVLNPFLPVRGAYHGLFRESGQVLHGSSGFFKFVLNDQGTYSAALTVAGRKVSVSGRLGLDGSGTNHVARPGTNALVITWQLALDGSEAIQGTVSDGIWTASLRGDRAVFNASSRPCPLAGSYTVNLPGVGGSEVCPEESGYGTLVINTSGLASFKAYLADKTSAAQKVPLSKDYQWPLYLSLSSRNGSLFSWVQLTNRLADDLNGVFTWTRPPVASSALYPNGFVVTTNLVGSRYLRPQEPQDRLLNLTNGLVRFSGGNLDQPYAQPMILGPDNKVTNPGPGALTVRFSVANGSFSGSFTPDGQTHRVAFRGAVLQKSDTAAGYFIGTNQSGRVFLEPQP